MQPLSGSKFCKRWTVRPDTTNIYPFFSPLIFQTVSQSMTTFTKSFSCFGSDRPSCCSTGAGLSCIFLSDKTSRYAWLQSSALLRGGRCSCCGMRLVLMQRSDTAPSRNGLADVQSGGGRSKQPRRHWLSPKITGSSVFCRTSNCGFTTHHPYNRPGPEQRS